MYKSMNILRIIQKALVEVVSLRSSGMNITKRPGNIVFVISYIILLIGFIVFFFVIMQYVRKKMSVEMDMSVIMSGKSVETDNFFINLYDYWTNFYHENKKIFFFILTWCRNLKCTYVRSGQKNYQTWIKYSINIKREIDT